MLFSVQKFLATRASADAAKWFAKTLRLLQNEFDLHSPSGPGNPNFGFGEFRDAFPALIRAFLNQSPPTWPGQKEVLHRLGLGSTLEFTFSMISEQDYRQKIIDLCTIYFCNAFYTTCDEAEAAGLPKGAEGKAALISAVNDVFSKEGISDLFELFEAEFRR
jgi:hypothetical protein